ncbi:putative quinol monooxygenase [Mycoplasmopsis iners]|uniref:putative quinol monooxygenase n=1 Tax=Mycoplasmopsis iners TaxID=76630 RepID=UPI00055F0D45|nr:hypothetical protein [Mycoplasmopsis iners]
METQEFKVEISRWIKDTKKQELNLSVDGVWKDENNFLLIERWSSAQDYDNFINSDDNKASWNVVKKFIESKPLIFKYETIF